MPLVARPACLTPRQREVLVCVARGLTNDQIAHALCISLDTVKNHVTHVLALLNVESRTAAAVEALRLGALTFDDLGDAPAACPLCGRIGS